VTKRRFGRTFLKKRLTLIALAIFLVTLYTPWIIEIHEYFGSLCSFYWTYMVHTEGTLYRHVEPRVYLYDKWSFFEIFWFTSWRDAVGWHFYPCYRSVVEYPFLPWLFIYCCQIATLILGISYLVKPSRFMERTGSLLIVFLPLISVTLCALLPYLWQGRWRYPSAEPIVGIYPYWGFLLALISVALLRVSFRKSLECRSLNRFKGNAFMEFCLICLLGFYVARELDFRTWVAKLMIADKRSNL